MSAEVKTIPVSQALYQRLERLAHLSGRTLESLVAQTLAANIPPVPDDLPPTTQHELRSLEHASDTELWGIIRQRLTDVQLEQWEILRVRQRSGIASQDELAMIDRLRAATDLLTLRKAYAAVILKWRGHRIPSLSELEA
jgi:hypothetical protein